MTRHWTGCATLNWIATHNSREPHGTQRRSTWHRCLSPSVFRHRRGILPRLDRQHPADHRHAGSVHPLGAAAYRALFLRPHRGRRQPAGVHRPAAQDGVRLPDVRPALCGVQHRVRNRAGHRGRPLHPGRRTPGALHLGQCHAFSTQQHALAGAATALLGQLARGLSGELADLRPGSRVDRHHLRAACARTGPGGTPFVRPGTGRPGLSGAAAHQCGHGRAVRAGPGAERAVHHPHRIQLQEPAGTPRRPGPAGRPLEAGVQRFRAHLADHRGRIHRRRGVGPADCRRLGPRRAGAVDAGQGHGVADVPAGVRRCAGHHAWPRHRHRAGPGLPRSPHVPADLEQHRPQPCRALSQ